MPPLLPSNPELETFLRLLLVSYERATGKALMQTRDEPLSLQLFDAPFALLSHDARPDPIYNFGNRVALDLWQMNFAEFTSLPSRLCAEPVHQDERQGFLDRVEKHGFVANYSGVRISKEGRRFRILDAICWNVLDQHGARLGQAASFVKVQPL